MSDLTRRVLAAHARYTAPDLHAEQADIDGPMLIDAAPVLARQIENVEEVLDAAKRLIEWEGENTDYAQGMTEMVARIREALNNAEEEVL